MLNSHLSQSLANTDLKAPTTRIPDKYQKPLWQLPKGFLSSII